MTDKPPSMREPPERSPMLRTIERKERNVALRRIGKISAAVIAGVLAVTAGPRILEWFSNSQSTSSGVQSGPCMADVDLLSCLDRIHNKETGIPFSHGDPDGCVLSSIEEQLRSPLCCPHVAADPMTCPRLNGTIDTRGSDPVDGDLPLPGGVEEKPEGEIKEPKMDAPPPSVPRRIPSEDIFDEGDVAPG